MFILGLLAFLQTTFIPGFILLKTIESFCGVQGRFFQKEPLAAGGKKLVYSFALSLLINYLLVFVFTALGIYKPFTLYVVVFLEGILLIYYCLRWYKAGKRSYITLDIKGRLVSLKEFLSSRSLGYNILLFFSVVVILWYIFLFFYFLGGVFQHWDPVISWNRFASEWASNQWPAHTWRYPQLIPANWSISYVMMQNTGIQCFARAIMPLFSLGVLLLFLDLALQRKKAVYLLGLVLYGILLGYLYEPSYIVSGYVDIAASFFAFLSFYVLHSPRGFGDNRRFAVIWQAIIFASAAAVTKQSGLFILAVILGWGLGKLYKNRKASSPKKIIGQVLLLLLTIIIITASWYIIKEIHIAENIDRSEIALVQGVHQTGNYMERLAHAFNQLSTFRHPRLQLLFWFVVFLVFCGVFHKKSWRVTLFIVIPYGLIWGFFFSYDSRNLAFLIPFMAYSAAFGLVFLRGLLPAPARLPRWKIPFVPLIITVLVVLAVLNFTILKKEAIIDLQTRSKMKIGNARLNEMLYEYHKKEGIAGKIATNYRYLKYLPGLGQFYLAHNARVTPAFLDYLESEKGKEIHYLLIPMIFKAEKAVYQRFQQKLASKEYRMIFKLDTYWFVRVKAKGPQ